MSAVLGALKRLVLGFIVGWKELASLVNAVASSATSAIDMFRSAICLSIPTLALLFITATSMRVGHADDAGTLDRESARLKVAAHAAKHGLELVSPKEPADDPPVKVVESMALENMAKDCLSAYRRCYLGPHATATVFEALVLSNRGVGSEASLCLITGFEALDPAADMVHFARRLEDPSTVDAALEQLASEVRHPLEMPQNGSVFLGKGRSVGSDFTGHQWASSRYDLMSRLGYRSIMSLPFVPATHFIDNRVSSLPSPAPYVFDQQWSYALQHTDGTIQLYSKRPVESMPGERVNMVEFSGDPLLPVRAEDFFENTVNREGFDWVYRSVSHRAVIEWGVDAEEQHYPTSIESREMQRVPGGDRCSYSLSFRAKRLKTSSTHFQQLFDPAMAGRILPEPFDVNED